jgi:hypothetical protein
MVMGPPCLRCQISSIEPRAGSGHGGREQRIGWGTNPWRSTNCLFRCRRGRQCPHKQHCIGLQHKQHCIGLPLAMAMNRYYVEYTI